MAYRKPGVTVTQEFAASAPALAQFNLPCCAIGPAFQIVNNDFLGIYNGNETSYAYAGVQPGAIVDLEVPRPNEPFPITKKRVEVSLQNTVVQIIGPSSAGNATGTTFSDATVGKFAAVLAGDKIVVTPSLAVAVVPSQTNGQSSDTTGQRNRLTSGVPGQFLNVQVGDAVDVTGGTNTVVSLLTVTIKLNNNALILSADVNSGAGPSTNVQFSVSGDRGVTSEGEYTVRTVVSANQLELTGPFSHPEAPLSYTVKRKLPAAVSVSRVEVLSSAGFTAEPGAVTLPLGYEVLIGAALYPVLTARVLANYRALRTDLASEIKNYAFISDVEAVFGPGQIVPQNPLAFALNFMKQNTVSSVNGLGLSADYLADETLSFLKAADVLTLEDMYALSPLSQLPTVHTLFKNHVTQLSLPGNKLERIVLINSKLETIGLVKDDAVTSTALLGARAVVTTQVDGAGAAYQPNILNDPSPGAFLAVRPGDSVTVSSGTGVTPGVYLVASVQTANQITLANAFISGGSPTDINYFIQRRDGLSSNGLTFFDRNASFISGSVAPGHFLEILAGPYKGRWKIASVDSEKQLTLAGPLLGVVSLVAGIQYEINKDLSKLEQAENIAGYSSSFGSRRVVHVWPDQLETTVGNSVELIPGYYACCAIGALTAGLPTQQGFTNMSLSGFIGFNHSTKYFSEEHLNVIADGGTLVLVQEGPLQPLIVRHQLTTDRSQIKFQEYSVTKNVDFIAKFMRNSFKGPVGKYNIVDTTFDYLNTIASANINFLKSRTRLPFLGGVILEGKLVSLAEDDTQIDTINGKFNFRVPIPLNQIDITIVV
jgi:hypothetical protein